jgi:hypothetical protein
MKLILAIIGLILISQTNSSTKLTKQINVEQLQTANPGSYLVYGLYAGDSSGKTLVSNQTDTIIAYGCEFCQDYGKAIIEKRGDEYLIKNFTKIDKLEEMGTILELEGYKAKIQTKDRVFWTTIKIKNNRGKAYLINSEWVAL